MNARHQLIDAETSAVIIAKLEVADTFWRRFRGLQFRRPLEIEEGLLLTPCSSIHTHWMRAAIDAAMLDEDGVVLAVVASIRPWRIVRRIKSTRSIVESASGVLSSRIHVGTRLKVTARDEDVAAESPPKR